MTIRSLPHTPPAQQGLAGLDPPDEPRAYGTSWDDPDRSEAPVAGGSAARRSWSVGYVRSLIMLDTAAVGLATACAYFGRFGLRTAYAGPVPYLLICVTVAAIWLIALRLTRSRDVKVIGHGTDEYRRVITAGMQLAGTVAICCYAMNAPVARGFVMLVFPLGTAALVMERHAARKWLHRRRRRAGGWSHRVLVVGSGRQVTDLVQQLWREPYAGYEVAGVCLPAESSVPPPGLDGVPVIGSLPTIEEAIARTGADTVAVTAASDLTATTVRRLGWVLQGSGVALVVAPALTDIAGPRIHTRPVGGLPLIHVEEPEMSGPRQAAKNLTDRVLALCALAVVSPFLLLVGLLIRCDSPGPAIFRQTRVGRGGRTFTMYKFRSMVMNAEAVLPDLTADNEHDGVLFKIRRDPRVTRVGRLIRKWSIDEFPQLFNVVTGDMSMVGPRPPLPAEVERYGDDMARRLLVRPGITGLWQVSGRSDLSWEDSIRLDLYYVENWSLTADLVILWKTGRAVLRGTGAY